MNYLAPLFALVLFSGLSSPVLAQTSGTSTTGAGAAAEAARDAAIKAGSEVIRDQAEKAAGRVFSQDQIRIIKDVLGAATGQGQAAGNDNAEAAREADDREGSDEGKKQKPKSGAKSDGKGKGKNKGMPPGLAKKGKLPPGLQKQLERGGSLPPGLAKRSLPDGLEADLGEPAVGTERAIVDNDVVLIEKGTGVILDVIRDVLGGGKS
ncbi:MAG: hypothetical protein ACPGOV_11625 [Magnetovibrionaceae bacterium]